MIIDIDRFVSVLEDAKRETCVLLNMALDEIDDERIFEQVERVFFDALAAAGVVAFNFIAFIAYVGDQIDLNQLFGEHRERKGT
jgi:hypothetical protein